MGFLLASQTVKSVKQNDYDLTCHCETNLDRLSLQSESRRRGCGLMSTNSGSDEFDEESKPQRGGGATGRQGGVSPDEEDEDEDEDSDEEDSDSDSEPSRAPEGAYDPVDYANLPVSTEIKELFQYITR